MHHTMFSRRRPAAGFTLIETMCVVAITGILSSIAYPSCVGALHKARRSDALVAMMQVRLAQERFRADNPSYGGSLSEIGLRSVSASRHYALNISANSQTGFEVVAAATGAQQSDSRCRYLKLTVAGAEVSYASGPDGAVDNPDSVNRQCWGQ